MLTLYHFLNFLFLSNNNSIINYLHIIELFLIYTSNFFYKIG